MFFVSNPDGDGRKEEVQAPYGLRKEAQALRGWILIARTDAAVVGTLLGRRKTYHMKKQGTRRAEHVSVAIEAR